MKTIFAIISLSALLACLTLSAQETSRPAAVELADHSKQPNRKGGGKFAIPFLVVAQAQAQTTDPAQRLAQAIALEDLLAVRAAVAAGRAALGAKAGEPEVADEYRSVSKTASLLSPAEAQPGFTPHFAQLEKMRWWKVGVDPTKLTAPLRGVASVIAGNVAAVRAKLDGADRSLVMANDAADFLIWAQKKAGAGCYPFPAARGTSEAQAMAVATRFLQRAEKEGKRTEVVRNGWAFNDLGDGGLQFDNGECGVAMFDLYELTKEARYLDSARQAADWALSRPLCSNWNYNSFSIHLLAKAFAVTGEAKYMEAALHKARIGVIPGQLTDGPRAGRWLDPHNARPAYHYIMMTALAQLAVVLPPSHEHRAEVLRALSLGLQSRNSEMVSHGVMNKDSAIAALLSVNRAFKDDAVFLRETQSTTALAAVGGLVSAEARRGKQPLSPGEWGQFLEFVVSQPTNKEKP